MDIYFYVFLPKIWNKTSSPQDFEFTLLFDVNTS